MKAPFVATAVSGVYFSEINAMHHPGDIADRILDCIHAYVRKQLPECKGRTITELTVLFSDLHAEITDILADTDRVTEDD